jgi:hypothetical protein
MVMLRTMAIVSVLLLNHRTNVPLLRPRSLDGGRGLLRRRPHAERDQRVVTALVEPISDEARVVAVGAGEVGLRAMEMLISRSEFHPVESDTCLLHQAGQDTNMAGCTDLAIRC